MRLCVLLAVAGCWTAATPEPRAHDRTVRRAVSLAVDTAMPGRLVIDRDGVAWQAHCDGAQLRVRPWQGGEPRAAGPCAHRDTGSPDVDEYANAMSPIAINRDTVAIYLDTSHELVVTSAGGERRYPIGEAVRDMTIAIDGDAIVLVVRNVIPGPDATVNSTSLGDVLAALVRIEGGRVDVHPLQRYRGTDPALEPKFVTAGKDRLLLVASSGSAVRCTYRGACSPMQPGNAVELDGALALPDGGMIVFDFDYNVSRLAADGHQRWTTKVSALSLIGATADDVWVKSRPDDPLSRGLPIVALSLSTGAKRATPAISRTQDRDELGRYLEINGVAPTPVGAVVRGEFAGTLTVANYRLETQVRGAVCWWRNPHDGDEYPIEVDGSCDGRYRKALLTDHAAFVAVNPAVLRQRDN